MYVYIYIYIYIHVLYIQIERDVHIHIHIYMYMIYRDTFLKGDYRSVPGSVFAAGGSRRAGCGLAVMGYRGTHEQFPDHPNP